MAQITDHPVSFANVGKTRWWHRGLFASQTGYVLTTLGMLSIVRGLAYVISNGRGSFPGGPDADYFYALTSGDVYGLPAPFIYLVMLAAVMAVGLHHSSFGPHV